MGQEPPRELPHHREVIVTFKNLCILAMAFVAGGCSLATTRPVQEMSNAESAIRAAKNLHADTLTPDLFRAATDSYYKAKKEYRLKNFDLSEKLAFKARKYAEKAEFQAYLKGGAQSEVAGSQKPAEGAMPDPEAAFDQAHKLRETQEAEKSKAAEAEKEERNKKLREEEPKLPADEEVEGGETKKESGSAPGDEKAPKTPTKESL